MCAHILPTSTINVVMYPSIPKILNTKLLIDKYML